MSDSGSEEDETPPTKQPRLSPRGQADEESDEEGDGEDEAEGDKAGEEEQADEESDEEEEEEQADEESDEEEEEEEAEGNGEDEAEGDKAGEEKQADEESDEEEEEDGEDEAEGDKADEEERGGQTDSVANKSLLMADGDKGDEQTEVETMYQRARSQCIKDMDSFIGLADLKTAVRQMLALIIRQKCTQHTPGADVWETNISITGNSGTGKTSIIKCLYDSLYNLRIIKGGFVETTPSRIGTHGALKETFKTACDGVLLIDEAYALNKMEKTTAAILPYLLTNDATLKRPAMIICAGYPTEMNSWMGSNKGLSRRFNHVHIPDYTALELQEIFKVIMKRNNHQWNPDTCKDAIDKAISIITSMDKSPNAGGIRCFIKNAVANAFDKLIESGTLSGLPLTLDKDDFEEALKTLPMRIKDLSNPVTPRQSSSSTQSQSHIDAPNKLHVKIANELKKHFTIGKSTGTYIEQHKIFKQIADAIPEMWTQIGGEKEQTAIVGKLRAGGGISSKYRDEWNTILKLASTNGKFEFENQTHGAKGKKPSGYSSDAISKRH